MGQKHKLELEFGLGMKVHRPALAQRVLESAQGIYMFLGPDLWSCILF